MLWGCERRRRREGEGEEGKGEGEGNEEKEKDRERKGSSAIPTLTCAYEQQNSRQREGRRVNEGIQIELSFSLAYHTIIPTKL